MYLYIYWASGSPGPGGNSAPPVRILVQLLTIGTPVPASRFHSFFGIVFSSFGLPFGSSLWSLFVSFSDFLHPNFEHGFCSLYCVFYIDVGTLNLQNDTFYHNKTNICRKPPFLKQIQSSVISGSLLADFDINFHVYP